MKTIRTIITLALLVICTMAQSQTTYKEAFKAMVEASPSAMNSLSPEKMETAIEGINKMALKNYTSAESERLVKKYVKEKFMDDLIESIIPYLENNVSVAELNELTAAMLTPQGKNFQEHQTIVNSKTNEFETLGANIAEAVMSGEETKNIQPIECPNSYKKLFEEYYAESGLSESVLPMLDVYAKLGDTTPSQKEAFEKMKHYFADNLPTIYLNASYGVFTEDDLKFGIKLYRSTAWKNEMKAVKDMMTHVQEFGMNFLMSYLLWLNEQGVDLNM